MHLSRSSKSVRIASRLFSPCLQAHRSHGRFDDSQVLFRVEVDHSNDGFHGRSNHSVTDTAFFSKLRNDVLFESKLAPNPSQSFVSSVILKEDGVEKSFERSEVEH